MKIGTVGGAPSNLRKERAKRKTEARLPMITGARRRSLKVIKSEIFPLIENAITEEFKDKHLNCSKEPTINSNVSNAKAGALVIKNEDVVEADEDDAPNTLSEIAPNETACPAMRHFGMPFDNE